MMYASTNPGQAKILVKLGEECAEVQQELAKIMLWGPLSINPYEPHKGTNSQRLEQELGHLMHWVDQAIKAGLVSESMIGHWERVKAQELST